MNDQNSVNVGTEHSSGESSEFPRPASVEGLARLPAVFRGVFWDDGWEFDAPCVMYEPFERYSYGGNSGEFDSMVERECISLALGETRSPKFTESEHKEFKWRGWSVNGFSRRKNAWHIEIAVQWRTEDSKIEFAIVNRRERWGSAFAAVTRNDEARNAGTTTLS